MTAAPALDRAAFALEWESWHRAHEERRASDDGFLAVTGLYWLDETPVQPAGAPGAWTTGPDGVEVRLAAGESVTVDGREVTGGHRFAPIAERASVVVGFADGVIEVARRGGRDILRPRRRDAAYLAGYHGTPTYVPNTRWRAEARFEAYDAPRPITVDAAVDGIQHVYDAPGELAFSLRGEEFRLIAFPGRTDDLLVLFTDATSGLTTYAASRSLAVPPPDADGRTVIDFNRAVNLPCAYTDFATCPLPPTGNRLPVGIEGGEKTPLSRVVGHVTAHGLELAPVEATPVEAAPAEVAPAAEVAR